MGETGWPVDAERGARKVGAMPGALRVSVFSLVVSMLGCAGGRDATEATSGAGDAAFDSGGQAHELDDCATLGIAIEAPFASAYSCHVVGVVPGLPSPWGGLTTKLGDPDTLLIGGAANQDGGGLYQLALARSASGHIVGFHGSASPIMAAPWNDGSILYGPGEVLFLVRWPVNELGQVAPGAAATKVTALAAHGIAGGEADSISGLNFAPPRYQPAGQMKVVTWPDGHWYAVDYAPAGDGTFDIGTATHHATLPNGPEAFLYVEAGNVAFEDGGLLLAEWGTLENGNVANVVAYDLDGQGNPLARTRRPFFSELPGALGAFVDPTTGDFLFATFGGIHRLIEVRGLAPPAVPE